MTTSLFFQQDGTNSLLTNIFKVALLPSDLYNLAVRIVKKYEEGELTPPSTCNQRQRRSVSSSSFKFLQGLNPQLPEDQERIAALLKQWEDSKIRPQVIWSILNLLFKLNNKVSAVKKIVNQFLLTLRWNIMVGCLWSRIDFLLFAKYFLLTFLFHY